MFSWRRQELAHLDVSWECRKSAGLRCIASGALAVSRCGLSCDRGREIIDISKNDRRCVDLSAGGLGVGSSISPLRPKNQGLSSGTLPAILGVSSEPKSQGWFEMA